VIVLRLLIPMVAIIAIWRWYIIKTTRPTPNAKDLIVHSDANDRLVGLTSVANLRDIGGYHGQGGRLVKYKMLYRSASLAYVSDKEIPALENLNLKLICDLRTPQEVSIAPDKVPQGARYWHLPMLQVGNRWLELMKMYFVPNYLSNLITMTYIRMLKHQTNELAQIFRQLTLRENLPTLVHCSAGKDRTGITVALLLGLLGVSEKDILADYSQTNYFFDYIKGVSSHLLDNLGRVGIAEESLIPLLLADQQNLKTALDQMLKEYGSYENYFLLALNLDRAEIDALKHNFLEA
jgi:protein-tyrosine phosphatase